MCGLFGAATTFFLSNEERHVVEQLGIISQLRGMDSTGITAVRRKKNRKFVVNTHKAVLNASNFFEDQELGRVVDSPGTFVLMGHTRKATCGALTEKNAHPINISKITGAHNGIIPRFTPADPNDLGMTDSRKLFEEIASKGLTTALKNAEDGSYALTYIDAETKTLNFIRNEKRTLSFMYSDDKETLYWASERAFLEMVRTRQGYTKFQNPISLKPGVLYTIPLGSLAVVEKVITEDKTVPFESVFNRVSTTAQRANIPMGPTTPVTRRPEHYSRYRGWERTILPIDQARALLQTGCTTCRTRVSVYENAMWIAEDKYVCGECIKDRFTENYVRESFGKMFLGTAMYGSSPSVH